MSLSQYRFPEDHPIELLQGARRLHPSGVKRALAKRAAYLVTKIDREKGGGCANLLMDELRAIAQVMSVYEEYFQRSKEGREQSQETSNESR